jgi:hypothetical protein
MSELSSQPLAGFLRILAQLFSSLIVLIYLAESCDARCFTDTLSWLFAILV